MWRKFCTMRLTDRVRSPVKTLRLLATCLCALVLWACAAESKHAGKTAPGIAIEGIKIINQLGATVTDVQILVPLTGNFVSCGTIVRHTSCSTSFPGRQYERSPVQVSWKEQGQAHATGNFVIQPPANLDLARPMWIEVVIFAPGQAGAKMVQYPQQAGGA